MVRQQTTENRTEAQQHTQHALPVVDDGRPGNHNNQHIFQHIMSSNQHMVRYHTAMEVIGLRRRRRHSCFDSVSRDEHNRHVRGPTMCCCATPMFRGAAIRSQTTHTDSVARSSSLHDCTDAVADNECIDCMSRARMARFAERL